MGEVVHVLGFVADLSFLLRLLERALFKFGLLSLLCCFEGLAIYLDVKLGNYIDYSDCRLVTFLQVKFDGVCLAL